MQAASRAGRVIPARWAAAPALAAALGAAAWLLLRPDPGGLTVRLRGYQEAAILGDGTLLPRVLGAGKTVGLCVRAPAERDTSQWQARLFLRGRDLPAGEVALCDPSEPQPAFADPGFRIGPALCFERPLPEDLPASPRLELCGEVRDAFDGRRFELPCESFRYEHDDAAWKAAVQARQAVLREAESTAEILDRLDRLAQEAERFPFEGMTLRLVAVYCLRQEGTPEALEEARRRLDDLPRWLDQPAGRRWVARVALDRARLELGEGRLGAAWELFREAEESLLDDANRRRIRAVVGQATVLAQVGAWRAALERLEPAIEECEGVCAPVFVREARHLQAWLLHLDPESALEDRRRMAESLAAPLDEQGAAAIERLERVNQRVSLAYFQTLEGGDPGPHLASARELLAGAAIGTARARALGHWADLVEALDGLSRGHAERALELCGALAGAPGTSDSSSRDLAVWGLSCAGRAQRQLGDLEAAARAFERALLYHEHASLDALAMTLVLGPGQRADDYYQAARVELERGEARGAWEILARLDRLSLGEEELRRCREQLAPESRRQLAANEARRRGLLEELAALEGPASGALRRQREPQRQVLKREILELWQSRPGCPQPPSPARDPELRYRAVPLPDEILVLRQDPGGEVALERRHPLPRRQLREITERIHAALERADLGDAAWRELVRPLAEALVPGTDAASGASARVTPFALHGVLQGAPLAALPLPGAADGEAPWYGDVATPVLRPAATVHPGAGTTAAAPPLFVVDPNRNLPSAAESLALYRDLFPAATLLHGRRATRGALLEAVSGARWLHVDAHGHFDPAFPELSSLELADEPIKLLELAAIEAAPELVNLSGCQTGRWPTTADSGRYGLAGLFARGGSGWVIGAAADLDDRLAADFNRAFYRQLAAGAEAPRAFAHALGEARRRHPAAAWASLLLLRGAQPTARPVNGPARDSLSR